MVSTYAYFLKYHYFPTQSITNAILTVAGDGIAQTQEAIRHQASNDCDNKEDVHTDVSRSSNQIYDPKRGLVYFFKGLGSGIMWAWWFDMADVLSMELTESALSYGSGIDDGGSSSFQEAQEVIDFATSAAVLAGTAANDGLSVAAQTIRTAINIFLEQFLVCPILFTLWDIPVTSTMRGCPAEQVPTQIREKLLPLLVANAKVWTLVNVVTYNIPLEYRLLFTSAASIVSESINSGITSKQVVVPETPKPPPIVANPVAKVGMGASINSAAAATVAAVVPLGSSGGINAKNITILEL
jgi:phage tail protein X